MLIILNNVPMDDDRLRANNRHRNRLKKTDASMIDTKKSGIGSRYFGLNSKGKVQFKGEDSPSGKNVKRSRHGGTTPFWRKSSPFESRMGNIPSQPRSCSLVPTSAASTNQGELTNPRRLFDGEGISSSMFRMSIEENALDTPVPSITGQHISNITDAIVSLGRKLPALQKKWIPLEEWSRMARLAVKPTLPTTQKEMKSSMRRSQSGYIELCDSLHFDPNATIKQIFRYETKVGKINVCFIYFHPITGSKKVIQPGIETLRNSLNFEFPLSDFMSIEKQLGRNSWYAEETAKLFQPTSEHYRLLFEGSTRDLAESIRDELQKAASNREKMEALIDGWEFFDEAFYSTNEINHMMDRYRDMAIVFSGAITEILKIDGTLTDISNQFLKSLNQSLQAYNSLGLLRYKAGTRTETNNGMLRFIGGSEKRLMDWFALFRQARKFPNSVELRDRKGPSLLLAYPDFANMVRQLTDDKLEGLSPEKFSVRMREEYLPMLIETLIENDGRDDALYKLPAGLSIETVTPHLLLKHFGVQKLCLGTARSWMKYLG